MPRRKAKRSLTATQQRKKEHLELCLDAKTVTTSSGTGLDRYHFVHNALPELDIDEIDLSAIFLGRRLKAPILISSMTGGFDLAQKVNRNLALAAQQLGRTFCSWATSVPYSSIMVTRSSIAGAPFG